MASLGCHDVGMNKEPRPTSAIDYREATGTSVRRHYAQRVDGQWFTRYQGHDPRFGYRWTRWVACDAPRIGFDYDHDYAQASAGTMRIEGCERLRLPASQEGRA